MFNAAEYKRQWRKANRDKVREYERRYRATHPQKKRIRCREKLRASYLKRTYGMLSDDYVTLYRIQEGKCAICKTPHLFQGGRLVRLHVDHDHSSGQVRGLLCWTCNTGIGLFSDSEEVLANALVYIARTKQKAA